MKSSTKVVPSGADSDLSKRRAFTARDICVARYLVALCAIVFAVGICVPIFWVHRLHESDH